MTKKPVAMCSGKKRKGGFGYRFGEDRFKPCINKASVVCSDDQKPYCKACCPSLKREKDEARSKASSDRWAREDKHRKLKDAIVKADAKIVAEALRASACGVNGKALIPIDLVFKASDAREKLRAFELSAPKPKVHA